MTYDKFLEEVQNRTKLKDELEASTAITATQNTLAERLNPDEREKLTSQLPEDLKKLVTVTGEAEELSIDEFFDRVSQRMGAGREKAEVITDQVISILADAVTDVKWMISKISCRRSIEYCLKRTTGKKSSL